MFLKLRTSQGIFNKIGNTTHKPHTSAYNFYSSKVSLWKCCHSALRSSRAGVTCNGCHYAFLFHQILPSFLCCLLPCVNPSVKYVNIWMVYVIWFWTCSSKLRSKWVLFCCIQPSREGSACACRPVYAYMIEHFWSSKIAILHQTYRPV